MTEYQKEIKRLAEQIKPQDLVISKTWLTKLAQLDITLDIGIKPR